SPATPARSAAVLTEGLSQGWRGGGFVPTRAAAPHHEGAGAPTGDRRPRPVRQVVTGLRRARLDGERLRIHRLDPARPTLLVGRSSRTRSTGSGREDLLPSWRGRASPKGLLGGRACDLGIPVAEVATDRAGAWRSVPELVRPDRHQHEHHSDHEGGYDPGRERAQGPGDRNGGPLVDAIDVDRLFELIERAERLQRGFRLPGHRWWRVGSGVGGGVGEPV